MGTPFSHGVDVADGVADPRAVVLDACTRITVLTPTLIRLEFDPHGAFEDRPSFFALHRRHATPPFEARLEGEVLEVTTNRLRVCHARGGGFFNAGNLSIELLEDVRTSGASHANACWRPGDTNRGNLGGTVRTLDNCRGPLRLDDGLLSRDGWFLLDDTRTPVFTENWIEPRHGEGRRDWYFFGYRSDYKQALRDLVTVSGRIPVPPPFVFGSWYSRYWAYSAEDYRRLVDEFASHDFPLDVLVLDMDWHKPGWTGYSWNRELIPDPDALLRFMKGRGVAVTLNLHPASGVHPHEDVYEAFARAMGVDTSARRPIPFDCTSPRFMEHYFKLLHHPLERQGVDFWWLDWQQQKTSAIARLDPLTWLNHLHYHNLSGSPQDDPSGSPQGDPQAGVQGALEERPLEDAPLGNRFLGEQPPVDGHQSPMPLGDRLSSRSRGHPPLIFSRWGGWGSQRYPVQFSGDAESTWEVLKFQVKLTATAGNVGCVYWSHDIGGHWSLGGRCDPELFVRWLQFGALSPILRVHSTRDPLNDRRPWLDGEPYTSAARKAYHLRRALRLYLESLAAECHDTGLPLCRPMHLDHPSCENAYAAEHQYMLGDRLLVVPVTTPVADQGSVQDRGARVRCWLPPGEWIVWESGARLVGPAWLMFSVKLDAMLMIVRPDALNLLPDSLRRRDGVTLLSTQADEDGGSPRQPSPDAAFADSHDATQWLDDWNFLGPFPPGAEARMIDAALQGARDGGPRTGDTWRSPDGFIYEWRRYRTIASTVSDPAQRLNHTVNMKAVFGETEAVGLATTQFSMPSCGRATMFLRHDDPLTLYVNGLATYVCEKVRPVYDPPEQIPVDSRPGRNCIVVQQSQFGDRWGFDLGLSWG